MYTHRINKVSLDFSFPKKEKETALQTSKQLFYDKAMPRLNDLFNNVQEQLRIDKLEIDLGKTTTANFEQDFLSALKTAFEKQRTIEASLPGKLISDSGDLTPADALFFLERGYWSWNFQLEDEPALFNRVNAFFKNETAVMSLLQRLTVQKVPMAERLIHLASAHASTRKLFTRSLAKHHPALAELLTSLSPDLEQQFFIPDHFYFYFIQELIIAPVLNSVNQVNAFVKQLINQYAAQFEVDQIALNDIHQLITINPEKTTTQSIVHFIQTHFTKKISPSRTKNEDFSDSFKTDLLSAPSPETEKINILNAGLILFHPYLQPVFRDLKWIDNKQQFLNRKTQQKAVFFLQYLVNGKSRQAEHLLVLNKILCNWPVHLPLSTSCNFSAREKAAAGDLLESFREHWTVMKNTSNRGLVESFVARPGLVQTKQDGFLLQVEKKTIDILMESLPFGINTIKLPWNEYLIYTEW